MLCTVIDIRGDYAFVKYDDTDDGVSNPAWKIASMKEIVDHAE